MPTTPKTLTEKKSKQQRQQRPEFMCKDLTISAPLLWFPNGTRSEVPNFGFCTAFNNGQGLACIAIVRPGAIKLLPKMWLRHVDDPALGRMRPRVRAEHGTWCFPEEYEFKD